MDLCAHNAAVSDAYGASNRFRLICRLCKHQSTVTAGSISAYAVAGMAGGSFGMSPTRNSVVKHVGLATRVGGWGGTPTINTPYSHLEMVCQSREQKRG